MTERFNKFIEENYDTQNTKNEQKKDLCIIGEQLTEQWKKGELDIDECYFAETEGGIYKATGEYLNRSSCINGFDITSILEPVPSYEEWEQLQNWADFTDNYHELKEKLEIAEYEKAELKELLKELKQSVMFDKDLVSKIDEVLNE